MFKKRLFKFDLLAVMLINFLNLFVCAFIFFSVVIVPKCYLAPLSHIYKYNT